MGMRTVNRFACMLVLVALALGPGCEDLPAGPDALEALAAGEARASGLSLRDLFAAAMFRVQREEGTDTAIAVLQRWRTARDAGADEAALRAIEANTVLRAFGPDVVAQAAAVVSGEIGQTELAATRVAGNGAGVDMTAVRATLDAAGAAVERARGSARSAPDEALLLLDAAATDLNRLRAELVDAEGLPSLEALYARALAAGGTTTDEARAAEAALTAAMDSARQSGGVDERYRAQEALRAHRATVIIERLGPDIGTSMLADVGAELGRLHAVLDSLDHAGRDIGRDRRMAEAAAAIAERGSGALEAGDTARALDLAAHAAGLVDELRRRHLR